MRLRPERAVAGAEGVVEQTVKLTLRNVWAEAKAALAAVGLLVGLTLVASVLLGLVLQPALEIFIAYLTLAMLYVQLAPDASPFWVLFSLGASMLFLVLNLAVVAMASSFFLGEGHRLARGEVDGEVLRRGEPGGVELGLPARERPGDVPRHVRRRVLGRARGQALALLAKYKVPAGAPAANDLERARRAA